MKNEKNIMVKLAKAAAEKALRRDANRTTCVWLYQAKVPAGLERFRKRKVTDGFLNFFALTNIKLGGKLHGPETPYTYYTFVIGDRSLGWM